MLSLGSFVPESEFVTYTREVEIQKPTFESRFLSPFTQMLHPVIQTGIGLQHIKFSSVIAGSLKNAQ
jgi:hypothetical protein